MRVLLNWYVLQYTPVYRAVSILRWCRFGFYQKLKPLPCEWINLVFENLRTLTMVTTATIARRWWYAILTDGRCDFTLAVYRMSYSFHIGCPAHSTHLVANDCPIHVTTHTSHTRITIRLAHTHTAHSANVCARTWNSILEFVYLIWSDVSIFQDWFCLV